MRGSALEALVRRSAKRQEVSGLHLTQSGPRFIPGRAIGPRGEVAGRVIGAGALDFSGDLNGRAVTFDAKSTESRTRFDLRLIKSHQATIVQRAHARGVVAFFLIEMDSKGTPKYFALTWPDLAEPWQRFQQQAAGYVAADKAASSIPVAQLERGVEVIMVRGNLDLVRAIREVMARGVSPAVS